MTARLLWPRNPGRVAIGLAVALVGLAALCTALRAPHPVGGALAFVGLLTVWPYVLWLSYGPPAWAAATTLDPQK